MATSRTQPTVGLSDPTVLRSIESQLAQSVIIANGKSTVSDGEAIFVGTTASVNANNVTLTTSANNQPADVVTVYSSQGTTYVSAIDQTIRQTVVNQTGVYAILAGNGVNIVSSSAGGSGTVTVSTTAGNIAVINLDGNVSNVLRGNGSWGADANSAYGNSNVVSLLNAFGSNTITTTGNVSVGNIIGNGQALTAIAGANVSGFVANANVATPAFSVAAANVSGLGNIATLNLDGNVSNLLTGNGTYVAIPVVPTVGNIATLNLDGSNSNVLYGNGVFAPASGGNANTGNITFSDQIVIGTGSNDGSGGLYLAPGNNSIANSAVQYLRVRGGDVVTHIHLDTGNNQFYDQYFGDDAKYVKLELGDAGNVVIGTDDANGNQYNWSFTSDGNLILAGGDSVIQSIANSSLDPNNANVSTMIFTPDQNYTSQSLVIDPTGPSHIHLRAPGANIDEPDANIFLGGEASSFEVGYYNGNVPNLYIHSNNNTWTFGTDGNLTTPSNLVIGPGPGSGSSIFQYNEGLQILGEGANSVVQMGWTANTSAPDSVTTIAMNYPGGGEGNVLIAVGNNATTVNYWLFDNTGNLRLPGNTVAINFANGSSAFGNIVATNLDGNVSNLLTGNGTYVAIPVVPTVGNIATINLDGSNSNVLYGNGTFAAVSTSFDGEMHVSKDGNDSTGTGTILRPYLTITHALTQVAGGRNTIVIHPGEYTENPTITSTNTQLITYDATGASTIVIGTVTMANVDSRIAGLRMANLIIAGNSQAYISMATVTEQFTKSSSGYVEVDDCELQVTGNVLISGSGSISIVGNKINNLVVNNAGAAVLVKGADDCVMPQVTAGSLNIVDSIIRASSNTANAVTASAGTVVTLMNNQIVTPAADNVARVSIAGYHSIISLVYDKANSTLSNSLNSVAYFQTANVDSLVSSGNITGNYILGNGSGLTSLPAPTVAQDITSNGAMSIMTYDGNLKYVNYATVEPSTGNITGGNISANGNISGGNISATGNITANNLGNIISINLDGNVSNVLNGNGAFVALPVINANTVIWSTAPVANTSTGTPGQAAYDSGGNLYVCVVTDTWAKFTGTTSW